MGVLMIKMAADHSKLPVVLLFENPSRRLEGHILSRIHRSHALFELCLEPVNVKRDLNYISYLDENEPLSLSTCSDMSDMLLSMTEATEEDEPEDKDVEATNHGDTLSDNMQHFFILQSSTLDFWILEVKTFQKCDGSHTKCARVIC